MVERRVRLIHTHPVRKRTRPLHRRKTFKNSVLFRPPTTSRSVTLNAQGLLLLFNCTYYIPFRQKTQAFESDYTYFFYSSPK